MSFTERDPGDERDLGSVKYSHERAEGDHFRGRHADFNSFFHHEHERWEEAAHSHAPQHGDLDWARAGWDQADPFGHPLDGGDAGSSLGHAFHHPGVDDNHQAQSSLANSTSLLVQAGPGGVVDIGGNVVALGSQSTELNAGQSHDFASSQHSAQVETTDIVFNVASGGTLDVGGNVEALGNQSAELFSGQSHGFGGFLHNAQFETTDIIFNVASGGTLDIGGNVEALGNQSADLFSGQSHGFGSFPHNIQVETTTIIFNVASGGTLDIGGNVEAVSAQQSHLGAPAPTEPAHLA